MKNKAKVIELNELSKINPEILGIDQSVKNNYVIYLNEQGRLCYDRRKKDDSLRKKREPLKQFDMNYDRSKEKPALEFNTNISYLKKDFQPKLKENTWMNFPNFFSKLTKKFWLKFLLLFFIFSSIWAFLTLHLLNVADQQLLFLIFCLLAVVLFFGIWFIFIVIFLK